jgi:hypothetical protein
MKPSNITSQKVFGGLFAALLGLLSIGAAHAQVVLFNNFAPGNVVTPEGGDGSEWTYSSRAVKSAEEFSVPNGSNFVLSSVTLGLQLENNTDPSNFSLNLYSNNGGAPGSLIQTLATGTSGISPDAQAVTFTAPTGITLNAGQNYWIEMNPLTINTGSSANNNDVIWWFTQQPVNSTYAVAEAGPSGVYFAWSTGTGPGPNMLVDATAVVPETSTWALLLGGLGLLACWRLRTRRAQI